jgi:hypothetical protein
MSHNQKNIERWMNPWPEDAIVAAEASLNNLSGPISSKDIVVNIHDKTIAFVHFTKDNLTRVFTKIYLPCDHIYIWLQFAYPIDHIRVIPWSLPVAEHPI